MLLLLLALSHLVACKSGKSSDSRPVKEDYPTYSYHFKQLNHGDAEEFCKSPCQSHLASIHLWEQYRIAKPKIAGNNSVWIGLKFTRIPDQNDSWIWTDGTPPIYYKSNNSNASLWRMEPHQCIAINPQKDYKWESKSCNIQLPFLCNSCTDEKEYEEDEEANSIWVPIIVTCFGFLYFCCGACVVYWYMKKKIKKLKKQIKKDKGELPPTPQPGAKDYKLAKVQTVSTNNVDPGAEGDGNNAIEEGVEPEGDGNNTKVTKIESAVHLEIKPGDNDDDDEKKENKVLDTMLCDVMNMKSLDPNQIPVSDDNNIDKKQNDSDSVDTDDMYQDDDNDNNEKEMLNQQLDHLDENKQNDKSNEILKTMISEKMKMGSIDPSQMEQMFDDIFDNDENGQEHHSDDSDNMYQT